MNSLNAPRLHKESMSAPVLTMSQLANPLRSLALRYSSVSGSHRAGVKSPPEKPLDSEPFPAPNLRTLPAAHSLIISPNGMEKSLMRCAISAHLSKRMANFRLSLNVPILIGALVCADSVMDRTAGRGVALSLALVEVIPERHGLL